MPCTKCRQSGHNSRTCKNVLTPEALTPALEPNQEPVLTQEPTELEQTKPKKSKKGKEPIETKYYCYILGQSKQLQKGTGKTYNG